MINRFQTLLSNSTCAPYDLVSATFATEELQDFLHNWQGGTG